MNALEQFEADHAPGAMVLTASRWPCLVLPPEHRPKWLCSPYSLGLHMLGREPMPEGDAKTLRRGKLMEIPAKTLLAEDHAVYLADEQVRRERADVPAVCYLDGLVHNPHYERWAVEIKSMPDWLYRKHWDGEPPWYPRIQAQAQMAIDETLVGVLIVPIVTGYSGNPEIPQVYEEPRNEAICRMLVETGIPFLDMLRRGEVPPPDETVASYDALMRVLKIEPGETVTLADDADAQQFVWWQQAKHQAKAGDEMQAAAKRYFAARSGNASVIELPGVGRIERKQVTVKAEDQPRPARTDVRWLLKELP